jgi:transcriptional regulator with PAS, ATPase and Fis domain
VLLRGESGTGKELVARVLHERSRRSAGPFVAVNCAAMPDTLLESELFGHVRGAFTGAIADKPGRFTLAAGGTLFLDEIGDLSPLGQADLLRVLEDGMFQPIGSHVMVQADARVLAATNRDLAALCREGRFREDLFYRLNVIEIEMPPLRERPGDLERLAGLFVQHYCARHRRPAKVLTPEALDLLRNFSWPGNVRQLRNAVERAVLLTPRRELRGADFPEANLPSGVREVSTGTVETMREKQIAWAREMVAKCGGHKTRAAQRLKISRRTLHSLLTASVGQPS